MKGLSAGAAAFEPGKKQPASPATQLRALAQPFSPVSNKGKAMLKPASLLEPEVPTKVVPTPPAAVGRERVTEVAAASELSIGAQPYTPTRTPTGKVKAFPVAPVAVAPASSEAPAKTEAPAAPKVEAPATPVSRLSAPQRPAPKDAHRFRNMWTLYAHSHQSSSSYKPTLIRKVGDVSQFWQLLTSIPSFSSKAFALPQWTYYWFRGEVQPSWEDSVNAKGGVLTMVLASADRVAHFTPAERTIVDDLWAIPLMAAAGQSLPSSTIITGVIAKARTAITMEVWVDTVRPDALKELCDSLRKEMAAVDPKIADEKFSFVDIAQRLVSTNTKKGSQTIQMTYF